MSSKKITFSIPDWMYDGLSKRLSFINSQYRIDDFFKAAAINRFIWLGYLDEFGQPIPLPKLDLSVSSFPGSFDEVK